MSLRYGKTKRTEVIPSLTSFVVMEFTWDEISAGLISSLIILPPVILMILLFRKSKRMSKRESRFDKVIQEAVEKDLVHLPEKSYQRTQLPNMYVLSWFLISY